MWKSLHSEPERRVRLKKELPTGFYNRISKLVVTMAVKSISVGNTKVFDTKSIYSRVGNLITSKYERCKVNINDVLSCELSPAPHPFLMTAGKCELQSQKQT